MRLFSALLFLTLGFNVNLSAQNSPDLEDLNGAFEEMEILLDSIDINKLFSEGMMDFQSFFGELDIDNQMKEGIQEFEQMDFSFLEEMLKSMESELNKLDLDLEGDEFQSKPKESDNSDANTSKRKVEKI